MIKHVKLQNDSNRSQNQSARYKDVGEMMAMVKTTARMLVRRTTRPSLLHWCLNTKIHLGSLTVFSHTSSQVRIFYDGSVN